MDYTIEVITPFSPVIFKSNIPDGCLNNLNRIADEILSSEFGYAHRDWSLNLAGNIKTEFQITDLVKNDMEIMSFLFAIAKHYATTVPNSLMNHFNKSNGSHLDISLSLDDCWVNEMIQGDFNPVHFHSGCLFSCVGFLSLPPHFEESSIDEKGKKNVDGCLQFIDSRTVVGASNMLLIRPKIGGFYIFPSWMLHCVYPFRGEGVRRSMSANFSLTTK